MIPIVRCMSIAVVFGFACLAQGAEYIKIASWNIQNLGGPDSTQAPAALAEHVRLSDADILALEEIHDTDGDPATRTSSKLDSVVRQLNQGEGASWRYILFEKRKATGTEQHCGVLWNEARVKLEGEPYKIPLELPSDSTFYLWDRYPHAVKFTTVSGKTDFVLIPLHMKANDDDGIQWRQRKAEAEALLAKLDDVREHFQDRDIVLLGDTNCTRADEDALKELQAAGFKDLNSGDAATFVGWTPGKPYDRILVPEGQPEFYYSRQYVLAACDRDAHTKYLSDHQMVLMVMRVLPDDD